MNPNLALLLVGLVLASFCAGTLWGTDVAWFVIGLVFIVTGLAYDLKESS